VTLARFCRGAADTELAGEQLARVLRPGDVVLLTGPLGAGKTTMAKGIARGLGVLDRVTSPTFVLVRQHRCRNDQGIETLHHADVYRTESLDEMADLALAELVEDSAVAVVEWGDLAAPLFGREVLTVALASDADEGRMVTVSGGLAQERLGELARWRAG
jgi:tRNA threonylcarbamoyladenosine biosynthesis protein TsaE